MGLRFPAAHAGGEQSGQFYRGWVLLEKLSEERYRLPVHEYKDQPANLTERGEDRARGMCS